MGNSYYAYDVFNIDASSTPGTGNTYYSSGWMGKRPEGETATLSRAVPIMGHLQLMWAAPWDTGYSSGEGSGSYWVSIETKDSLIIYQTPSTASGATFVAFPDLWYPPHAKIVVHATTGGTNVTIGGIVTDV